MFSSPCSLRFTQCAALIALAAAAGISRFEAVPARPQALRPVAAVQTCATATTISRAPFYLAAMEALVPRMRASRSTCGFECDRGTGCLFSDLPALAPHDSWPSGASLADSSLIFYAPALRGLSPSKHSYPYAAGPPRRRINQPLRAAGTTVPGDSRARRSLFSRIVRGFAFLVGAHVIRPADAGLKLAGSNFQPSSALRGEPDFRARRTAHACVPAAVSRAVFSP